MTTYQPTEEERAVVSDVAAKIGELQLLMERAAKLNIEVQIEPVFLNFFLFAPFVDMSKEVRPLRLSWSAKKVRIDRTSIAGN